MSYVNYWGTGGNISPNGDFGVDRFPELRYLVNEIDFTQWIFTNTNKDGIYEMAKETNDFMPDGFHPGTATHQSWADLIMSCI
jgi:lysophospholipase L1-like esterase